MNTEKTPKRKPGRPRKASSLSFDSLAGAALYLKCPIEVIKAAKKAGCPAFRSGRIYIEEVKAWLETNEADEESILSKERLQCRKLLAECQAKELQNEIEAGKYISLSHVKITLSDWAIEVSRKVSKLPIDKLILDQIFEIMRTSSQTAETALEKSGEQNEL